MSDERRYKKHVVVSDGEYPIHIHREYEDRETECLGQYDIESARDFAAKISDAADKAEYQ